MYFAPDTLIADTGAEHPSIRISNAGITIVIVKDLWKMALISYSLTEYLKKKTGMILKALR